jgi:hypothetical protein
MSRVFFDVRIKGELKEVSFGDFAKQVIYALKRVEEQAGDNDGYTEEWMEMLCDELDLVPDELGQPIEDKDEFDSSNWFEGWETGFRHST